MKKEAKPWWHKYMLARANQLWKWSPAKKAAYIRQVRPGGRYECQGCHERFLHEETEADHIIPKIPVTGWDTWDGLFHRLLDVSADGVQILCLKCHQKKSAKENAQRRKNKNANGS